jgi:hypothetical protein
MKNQVTNIEQSKRLIEMGVPAGIASMSWVKFDDVCFLSTLPYYKATLESDEGEEVIAAFMVYDLLSVLPKTITNSKGGVHKLHIEVCSSTNHCWCLFWGNEEIQIGWCERISFLHLIEDATEWLLSNGYKLNL